MAPRLLQWFWPDERVRREDTGMTSRQRQPRFVLFALTGLFASSIAITADGAESRVRAARSTPTSEVSRPANVPRDGAQDFALAPELRSVHFDTDQARMRKADAAVLRADAEWLKANPTHQVRVTAYADERGSRQHNIALAERRAETVRSTLVAQGVPAQRISIAAMGETGRCRSLTDSCLALNRRVDLLVARATDHQRP
jgi:peptidoglycan-associated lipoprotein